jgi:hypothetical protein
MAWYAVLVYLARLYQIAPQRLISVCLFVGTLGALGQDGGHVLG